MVKHIQEEMAKSGETVQPKEVENLVKALNEKEEILQATDTLQMGFDPMESEMENGIMSLPPTDGEIIFLNGNGEVEKKPVKKEKIVEISDGERPSCSDQQPIVAGHNQEFPETIGNGDFAHGVTMEEAEENTELTTNDELVVRQRKGRKRKPRKV